LSERGTTVAAFVSSLKDEETKAPLAQKARVSYGISVNYPYIGVESTIKNRGQKYYAIVHEYAHFIQSITGIQIVPYSFKGMISDAGSKEERDKRFVEYVNNPLERDAHLNQMVSMLQMGMSPNDVLDSMADRKDLIGRAAYGRILDEALKIFNGQLKERRQTADQGKTTRTASVGIGINDWWHYTLQEDLNATQHTQGVVNEPSKAKPYNLRNKRMEFPTGPKTTEGLLASKHDKEFGAQKTMEQLLRESRV
jgi:hypothetical protein